MNKPIVFMFSGQGSQYYQMGRELYDNYPRFKLWMNHCDEIVSPLIGTSLIDIIYSDSSKSQPFDRLLYTNPALLCIEFSLAKILMESGIQPDYLLGYSLGEISASVVAGAMTLEDGIQLSVDSAELMERECQPAAMLAIIESPEIINLSPELFEKCWLAGRNFENNFVVSGLLDDILKLQKRLSNKSIICQRLPVNFGFHTRLLDPVEDKFKRLLQKINIVENRIPIFSGLKSKVIKQIEHDYFWDVIRYPVEFEKAIKLLLEDSHFTFVDVGPSGTLATFVKYLLPENSNSTHLEVINQFGRNIQSYEKFRSSLDIGNVA